MQSGQVRCK